MSIRDNNKIICNNSFQSLEFGVAIVSNIDTHLLNEYAAELYKQFNPNIGPCDTGVLLVIDCINNQAAIEFGKNITTLQKPNIRTILYHLKPELVHREFSKFLIQYATVNSKNNFRTLIYFYLAMKCFFQSL